MVAAAATPVVVRSAACRSRSASVCCCCAVAGRTSALLARALVAALADPLAGGSQDLEELVGLERGLDAAELDAIGRHHDHGRQRDRVVDLLVADALRA